MIPYSEMKKINSLIAKSQEILSFWSPSPSTDILHQNLTMLSGYIGLSGNDNTYFPIHFTIQELAPPEMISDPKIGAAILWSRFRSEMLWTIDAIRMMYNESMFVNDWYKGGSLKYRGVRPLTYQSTDTDMHKMYGACDWHFAHTSHKQFVNDVLNNPNEPAFMFIRGLEDFDGMTWNHIDTRNVKKVNGKPMVFGNK